MHRELKSFWRRFLSFNWKFGLLLILIVCIPRFCLVMHANTTGNYGYIGLIMVISAVIPFVFLSKFGREKIGIKKTNRIYWLFLAFITGLGISLLLYFIGSTLYSNTTQNWYVYIGQSYKIPEGIERSDKAMMFAIVAITGMIFSPIGEELFFRGVVHDAFRQSVGEKRASVIDGAAFSFTHLAHFGIVYENSEWRLLLTPALIWVGAMFLVSLVFYYFRKRSASLSGAIFCHAAFNLGMTYSIFYWL